ARLALRGHAEFAARSYGGEACLRRNGRFTGTAETYRAWCKRAGGRHRQCGGFGCGTPSACSRWGALFQTRRCRLGTHARLSPRERCTRVVALAVYVLGLWSPRNPLALRSEPNQSWSAQDPRLRLFPRCAISSTTLAISNGFDRLYRKSG